MKWLKKKLRNWINEEDSYITLDKAIRVQDTVDAECIRFKIFRANGGTVVQTDQYDRKNDREYNNLHVIVDGQDIGKELGKIITFESLKL
jgi:deoxycytidine triphosphate deaminase